ncbi:multidrug resistance-associated protein 7 [Cimex lectularius]|uniref:ABC-type xenobiotic transporter n=1 Tax=Cimex lectularius TaxID=79782 RepID=A0A8I6S9A2_CIMLE|nr:multidrug resistance-associated protein 7 [Cimex lectularius]
MVNLSDFDWSWQDFCNRDSFVVWNTKHRDFDLCFQFLIFHIPVLTLVAVFSAYYTGALFYYFRRSRIEKWVLRVRTVTTLVLAGLPVVCAYMEEVMFPGHLKPVDYLLVAIECFAWLMHFCFLLVLCNKLGPNLRGPVFLGVIWAVNYMLSWVSLHSNYLIVQDPDSDLYASGVPFRFSIIKVVVQSIYLCTLIPSGAIPAQLQHFQSLCNQSGEQSPPIGAYTRFREDLDVNYLGVAMEGWNSLARLTFSWVNPLIEKGVQGLLDSTEDLYDLPNSMTVAQLNMNMSVALYHHPRYRSTLLRALHKCFWKEFYGIGVLKFIADVSGFCGPIFLNLLVKFIEDKTEPVGYGYMYAIGLSITALISAFCNSHFNFLMSKVGLKIKAALVSTIYKKTLTVNTVTMSQFSKGEVANYMSTDMDRIVNSCASFHAFWSIPLQLFVTLYLLYLQVGLSFLAGIAFSIVLIPINRFLAKQIGKLSEKTMSYKDARLQIMMEIFRGIKTIKLHVWENEFVQKVEGVRKQEMKFLSWRKYLDALCVYFWATTPVLISLLTFVTYTLTGNQLTASVVFTTIALINMLITPLNAFPWVLNGLTEAWVSLKRVERLIKLPDRVLKAYYDKSEGEALEIINGNFCWNETRFSLKGINVKIDKGQLIGIIGPVGSGKSSMIAAILSEIEKSSGSVSVLNYEEGFGYVPQTPWLQKGTILENILFGEHFLRHRYWSVLNACGLTEDINLLPGKDSAKIGEGGCTLSGGQKARIALARAVYQDKQIYLLDDILSAVDPQVAKHIFTQCICGILQNKTRLLFTHQSRFLINADHIIVLQDGKIVCQGRPSEVLPNYIEYVTDSELEIDESAKVESEENHSDKKSPEPEVEVEIEERAHGSMDCRVFGMYIMSAGVCLWPLILTSIVLMQISRNGVDYWLSYWVSNLNYTQFQEELSSNSTSKYLIIYAGIAGMNSLFTLFRAFLFAFGGLNAARKIHKKLLKKVIDAKMLFFETNSSGKILNRFSSDVYTIDDSLPFISNILLASIFTVLGTLAMTLYGLPWLFLILAPLVPIYHNLQSNYRLTSRELKRLTSTTMSPLYSHFNETLQGAAVIRAFRVTSRFMRDNQSWLESNIKAQLSASAASQWLGLRLQLIGVVMITGVAILATLRHHLDFAEPGLIGLAISYALTLTSSIGGLVNAVTETEREMVSVERVSQYLNNAYIGLEGEDKSPSSVVIPFGWPTQGVISFHNVFYRYSESLPYSLNEVTFVTRPGEKIGVVGRTGAGKSSLISALFRLSDLTKGEISVDFVNIKLISLDQLRSRMCIIPQDPFIFEGSMRSNLDPHNIHTDDELREVLEKTYMMTAVEENGGLYVNINKDTFSVGQGQLICLARAILKNTKIICIDEATANVDEDTDRLIQQTIRNSFLQSTVITIAHRVKTIIDCDRVLVMKDGKVVEFDTPSNLMENRNSHFYQLAHNL